MKKLLLILLISLLIASFGDSWIDKTLAINGTEITNENSVFIIKKDTLDFSINGDLRKVTYFNDKYYCMF